MKLILSRKGFDSAAGKAPSPIVAGRPISMPIPASETSPTTYEDIGLGDLVERVTRGKIGRYHRCHHDPMFVGGECLFGQCDAAQSHLANQGVGVGDVFLFFGLFADEATGERHHRFFGYMRVVEVHPVETLSSSTWDALVALKHPHAFGIRSANNTIYRGEGAMTSSAPAELRLTRPGGPWSQWTVPPWLHERGLSYHGNPARWTDETGLHAVARGQEFVCDIGDDRQPRAWAESLIEQIRA